MRRFLLAALLTAAPLLRADTPAKAVELFNGKDFSGWTFVVSPPAAPVPAVGAPTAPALAPGEKDAPPTTLPLATLGKIAADGTMSFVGKPAGYLVTDDVHKNYTLHVEWRWTEKPGNSGILLHIAPGPLDRGWPTCFQIQMKSDRLGDLLPMAIAKFSEPLTSAPGARVPQIKRMAEVPEKAVGEWNVADVTCRGDVIEYTLNGVLQNRVTACSPAIGRIGIQFEGTPFELRAVRLTAAP